MPRIDEASARGLFQVAFMMAAYVIPFELLILGLADPGLWKPDWILIVFAGLSGFSVLWSSWVGERIARHLHY